VRARDGHVGVNGRCLRALLADQRFVDDVGGDRAVERLVRRAAAIGQRLPLVLVRVGDRLDLILLRVGQPDLRAEHRQHPHRSARSAEPARPPGSARSHASAAKRRRLRIRILILSVDVDAGTDADGDEAGTEGEDHAFHGCSHIVSF